jgi:type IV pilus assembly protein PilW
MSKTYTLSRLKDSGFSLVEIMVALVIGMLATIVVLQLFSDTEARNRTASASADAQSNGVITFYQLQSNIERAGYGLNAVGLFGCATTWQVASGLAISKSIPLAPVSINPVVAATGALVVPAGDTNTDTLVLIYGNGNGEPTGNTIATPIAGSIYNVQMPSAFAIGDRVVAAMDILPDACVAGGTVIDRITAVGATTVTVATTAAVSTGAQKPSLLNLGRGPVGANAIPTPAVPSNGPTILAYAVRGGNLTVCDFTTYDCSLAANVSSPTVWAIVASNVVSMRAVYWKDTSAAWDGSTNSNDQTQPADACAWAKVKGINLVLVARSDERDKAVVTTTTQNGVAAANANAPSWSQVAVAPLIAASGALGPDTAADEDWKHYRYKTFQSVIPIRNVNWMNQATSSCP